MKIKMREYFQGRGVSATLLPRGVRVEVLEPGNEYEIDNATGEFLLKSHKAEAVIPAPTVKRVQVEAEPLPASEKIPEPAPRKRGRK